MNNILINNYNKIIKPEDECYHLGDFIFADIDRLEQVLSRLNSKPHLINGNHDQIILNNKERLIEKNLVKSIQDYKEITIHNQHICLFHFPMRNWHWAYKGSWHLHGHVHGELEPYGKSVDVGIDSPWITNKREYRPFSFYEIKDFMKNRENIKHHGD